ncbi:MAG: single-stranded-DNA-specific exonuclease RecJ [Clostridia bacterium]|nr:single-stranded-DNA-specific exonuclease RecJ [Clostridia bacterium]
MKKEWNYNNEIDDKLVQKIAEKYSINTLLSKILVSRNVIEDEKIETFLNPKRNNFNDPYLLPDMEKAVDRIINALEKNEKITIYGDYDVDGITATTVLESFLRERNANVTHYIPNRLEEGYGLNNNAIDKIKESGTDLMITVDCGITGISEVEYGKSLGLDIVVTDHHEPGDEIPDTIAVVDAKRKDNKYPFRELAGVGIAFKVIQAISIKLNLDEKEYLKYLDIVAIGTIADVVPLVEENRTITKLGLKLLEVTKNIGLKELVNITGYKRIDSNMVAFGIAPRINACGRMGKEQEALNLFLTQDSKEAQEIAERLNSYNAKRQELEKSIFEQAKQMAESDLDKNVLVLAREGWHHGVIGIVSSKITELYFKPSILIGFEGEEGKGSGRSVPGFDLHDAIVSCGNDLEKFGGHEMAIGLSLKKEKFEKFKEDFEKYACNTNLCDIIPIINIDEEAKLSELNIAVIKELSLLEPYGEANRMPIFIFKNLKINSIRSLSEGKHIKLTLQDNHYYIDAIGFNLGYLANEYKIGDKVDVVGSLEINEYNGNQNMQINLKDIRKA